jgi:hypothetical protein
MYALVAITVIAALGLEVWLFLTSLGFIGALIRRRTPPADLRLMGLVAVAAILLHVVSPWPLGTATKYAAVTAGVVFAVMTAFRSL